MSVPTFQVDPNHESSFSLEVLTRVMSVPLVLAIGAIIIFTQGGGEKGAPLQKGDLNPGTVYTVVAAVESGPLYVITQSLDESSPRLMLEAKANQVLFPGDRIYIEGGKLIVDRAQ